MEVSCDQRTRWSRLGVHNSGHLASGRNRAVRPKWIWTGLFVWVAVVLPGPEARGYRFYGAVPDDPYPPPAAGAERWDDAVWAPGEMLNWIVADDPRWTSSWTDSEGAMRQPPFGSPADVIPFVRAALEAWSEIPTADIRWEVSGVDPTLDDAVRDDGRPTIFVDPEAERGSYAGIWSDRNAAGIWETVDCDVPLAPFAAAAIAEDIWWEYVLRHEFGHCLGLAHAGAYPRINEDRDYDLRGIFGKDPLMSYGTFEGDLVGLAFDDRVGASLLRPAPNWERSTGAIAGSVTSGEDPAPFVQVFASRVSGGVAAGVVGSFTNADGGFIVEGLEPGQYLLWAGPLNVLLAHRRLFAQELPAALDVADQALLLPVTVTGGATAEGVEISLRAARTAQRRPGRDEISGADGPLPRNGIMPMPGRLLRRRSPDLDRARGLRTGGFHDGPAAAAPTRGYRLLRAGVP